MIAYKMNKKKRSRRHRQRTFEQIHNTLCSFVHRHEKVSEGISGRVIAEEIEAHGLKIRPFDFAYVMCYEPSKSNGL